MKIILSNRALSDEGANIAAAKQLNFSRLYTTRYILSSKDAAFCQHIANAAWIGHRFHWLAGKPILKPKL